VYGKILTITNAAGLFTYTYDASGNRISKNVGGIITTWYVRDASGNVMATYVQGDNTKNSGALTQTEAHVYGSSRLGILNLNVNCTNLAVPTANVWVRGSKFFELSNHLGNVLVTVTDKKIQNSASQAVVDYYSADVASATDYYPFGMQMPGRNFSSGGYRYGFNGQERSDEVKGLGNSYTAGFWEFDPRIGRRWNLDPVYKNSPYEVFAGNPILYSDPLGLDTITFNKHTTNIDPGRSSSGDGIASRSFSTFSIITKQAEGKDVFIYNNTVTNVNRRGSSTTTKSTILHPENEESASGITKGVNLYFDGLITTVRDNHDWETVAKIMDIDKAFHNYMVARNPNAATWEERTKSIELMEGLMPAFVKAGFGSYLGWRFSNPSINVDYNTTRGYPAWSTVQKRYWKIMNGGKTPQGTALVRVTETGQIEARTVSLELHHTNGRAIANPHAYENLQEVWPWEHAEIDPSRFIEYQFIRWVEKPKYGR
jgi:RHS repeat-associated protein